MPASSRNPLPFVRVTAGAGVGWVREQGTGPAARASTARLSADYVHIPGLVLGVEGELSTAARTYVTTLPALEQPGALELEEDERRMRLSLAGGWDALGSWVVSEGRSAGLLPRVIVSVDQFHNQALPHTSIEIGGGFRGFVRLAERLRVQTDLTYQYSHELADAVVKERALYGLPVSILRYEVGTVVEVSQQAGVHVCYAGEWLTQQHSDRFADAFLLGLILDI